MKLLLGFLLCVAVSRLFGLFVACGSDFINRNIEDEDSLYNIYRYSPVKYYDSDGHVKYQGRSDHHRVRRDNEETKNPCPFPEDTLDSALHCTVFPSQVICNRTCTFGLTLEKWSHTQIHCKIAEKVWRNSDGSLVEKCKPFLDCNMTFKSTGKAECVGNFMDKGPSCTASCYDYEFNVSTPAITYECDKRGKWKPALPFCMKNSGVKLIRQPRPPPPPPSEEWL